jgi:CheY-like chemotaxis protein
MPTLLLVDDKRIILEIEQAILAATSCRVVTARSGHEALAVMDRERPDLALIDLQMPMMDGLQTLRRIRENPHWSATKVILIAPEKDHLRCLAAGADGVGKKPLVAPALLDAIHRHIILKQRAHLRVNYNYNVAYEFGPLSDTGETKDLSLSGTFIRSRSQPPLGATGAVTIHGDEQDYVFNSCVVRVHSGIGFAVEYIDPPDEYVEAMADELEAKLAIMRRV